MTPFQFVDKFHMLKVQDAALGLDVYAKVKKYKAGWADADIGESNAVKGRLKKVKEAGGGVFYVEGEAGIDPYYPFYKLGLQRPFAGRGSPDECADALKLAVAAGRCKAGKAQAYAEEWFALDCNAFAGNFLGLSPHVFIGAYATGYDHDDIKSKAYLTAVNDSLPFPCRTDPLQVGQGDALLWFARPNDKGKRWRHIGIVQDFQVTSPLKEEGGAKVCTADYKVAQWGSRWNGVDESGHKTPKHNMTVVQDVLKWKPSKNAGEWADILKAIKGVPQLKGKVVTAIQVVYDGAKALVLIMDASQRRTMGHRGRHCGYKFYV